MAQALKNRVGEYSTTTGTGTYSFSGTKVAGHQLFVTAFANTNTIECCVVMGDDFEIGTYTFATGSPNTLARTSVRASTNSNNAVNWGAGSKEITQVVPADRIGFVLDGTVGAPSLAFYDDPDNGIYRTGANAWSLGCGGAQAIGITTATISIPLALAATTGSFSGLISANGGQIGFPATQNASAGVNVLDDYEEGTWTPTIRGNNVVGSHTYTAQQGDYVKCGQMVMATFNVVINAKDAAMSDTYTLVAGLPFTGAGVVNAQGSGMINWGSFTINTSYVGVQIQGQVTSGYIVYTAGAVSIIGILTPAQMQNGSFVGGTITYRANV